MIRNRYTTRAPRRCVKDCLRPGALVVYFYPSIDKEKRKHPSSRVAPSLDTRPLAATRDYGAYRGNEDYLEQTGEPRDD